MKIHSLYLLMCIVVFAGCEPCKHYNRLEVAAYFGPGQKKPYGTIRPYERPEEVGRPFEVIGFMSCEGSAAEEAAILKAMLYRAADMGADGLLLSPAKIGAEDVNGQRIDVRFGWMAMIGNGNQRAYRAQAIRFKEVATAK